MDTKPGSKGDASNTAFSSADKMRFCSLTYEIIEELRMRRELAADNEKKIEKLINDRFTMGWRLDQESGKVANLSERHEAELRETRRQLEEKMRDCQVEASQQQVYRKMAEKEKEALKDEIRRLQLANYSLEKRVRESERQEKIQANERDQHIRQVSKFESLYGQVDGMIKQLTSKQHQLDRDMKVVQNLNKSLQYQNSHQKCVLNMKETDLVKLRQQLLDTQVRVKVDPNRVQEKEEELQGEIRRLKTLVAKLEENCSSLDTDKDSWKEKYWESLKKLDDSHKFVNVHLHNAARFRDEFDKVEKLLRATEEKLEHTEDDLEEMRVMMESSVQKHKEDQDAIAASAAQLNSEIQDLKSEVQNLSSEKEQVEHSLNNANDTILDIKKQLEDAWTILNVEKFHIESQTHLQMIQMLDIEIQANPEMQNQESQIGVNTDSRVTQTIDPALCSTEVQTDGPVAESTEAQTDFELHDVVNFTHAMTQTDLTTMENKAGFRKDLEDKYEKSNKQKQSKVNMQVREQAAETFQESGRVAESSKQHICLSDENNESVGMLGVPAVMFQFRGMERSTNTGIYTNHFKNASETMEFDNTTTEIPERGDTFSDKTSKMKGKEDITETGEANVQGNVDIEDALNVVLSSDNEQYRRSKFDETNSKEDQKTSVQLIKEVTTSSDMVTGKESGDPASKMKSVKEITKIPAMLDRQVGSIGLIIPKIDIGKRIDYAGIVTVDPEEFSIKLTQDENMTDKVSSERAAQDLSGCDKSNIGYLNAREGKGYEAKKTGKDDIELLDESCEIDKAIEHNWEMSGECIKSSKPRAKKHKLNKETVKDQFTSFDMNKEKFQKSHGKEEIQPKQLKLTDMSGCVRLPKKQRSYSSMFHIADVVETLAVSEDKVQLASSTELQRSCRSEEVGVAVTTEVECPSFHDGPKRQFQLTCVNRHESHAQQNEQIQSQLSKECMIQNTEGVTGMQNFITSTSIGNPKAKSSPMFFAKPLLQAATADNSAGADTVSTTFKQENSYSSKQKEVTNEDKLSFDALNENPRTGTEGSPANMDVLMRNKPAQGGNTVCREKVSMGGDTFSSATSNLGNVPTAASVPELKKQTLGRDSEMKLSANSAPLIGMAPSTSPVYLPNSSDQRKTKSEGSTDFLQKYREIVAKIKPVQYTSLPKREETQKTTGITNVSPGTINKPHFREKISARGRTPKGILKGASRKDRKTRNVTWNEYVMNKDFIPDVDTSGDN